MMTTAILVFHVDEFFEVDLAGGDVSSALKQLPKSIDAIFSQFPIDLVGDALGELDDYNRMIYQQLAKFANSVLSLPKIQNASKNDKALLEFELKAYILANTQQLEDNFRLKSQENTQVLSHPPSTYIKWVHNTGCEHFGGYWVFAFILCLLDNGEDFIPNSEIKYIAHDCSRRVSLALRMFNDVGSLSRDRRECNLNSLFFPEFMGENKSDIELRGELVSLAKYEKKSLEVSLGVLEKVCGSRFRRVYNTVALFYNVLEYFTELYEVKKDLL